MERCPDASLEYRMKSKMHVVGIGTYLCIHRNIYLVVGANARKMFNLEKLMFIKNSKKMSEQINHLRLLSI